VLVRRFGLRGQEPGEGSSAGRGRWRGGEGCVRELEVTMGMRVSILSEVSGRVLITCAFNSTRLVRPTFTFFSHNSLPLFNVSRIDISPAKDQTALWHGRRWASRYGTQHVDQAVKAGRR
jgi:hypothetical protein